MSRRTPPQKRPAENGGGDGAPGAQIVPFDLAQSNSLTDLAARIRDAHAKALASHEAACAATARHAEEAMACGDLLIEAKAQVPQGQWLPWLKANCEMSDRTARIWMRLARNRAAIESEIGSAADLSIRRALERLAPVADDEDDPDPYKGLPPLPLAEGEFYLPIDDVKFRPELYPRLAFIPELVERYMEFLRDLPAIELNQHHVLIDGWHRWEAHKRAGKTEIRVRITIVGGEEPACGRDMGRLNEDVDHQLLAAMRNAKHGKPLPVELQRRLRDEAARIELLLRKMGREDSEVVAEAKEAALTVVAEWWRQRILSERKAAAR